MNRISSIDATHINLCPGEIMDYLIEVEKHEGQKIIHTTITGSISEEERNNIAVETVKKMRAEGIKKVIWDIRKAKLTYSLIGSHMVVLNLPKLGVKSDDYIAVIYYHDREKHEHAKTVAHNRGILNINHFLDLDEGLKWLLSR